MAQAAATGQRCKYGNMSFPILYEDSCLRVYKNPDGDIFVESVSGGPEKLDATIRFSQGAGKGELVFSANGRLEPTMVCGMIGWRLTPR
ncbi:MAG: hypothetical protein Q7T18_04515 [Sedimentisphaerales bacterium]|nr:hypothetical protein [Sedimentisphaerales bacterium]